MFSGKVKALILSEYGDCDFKPALLGIFLFIAPEVSNEIYQRLLF